MILMIKNIVTKDEETYKIHNVEDFDEIFERFPQTLDLALSSESVEDAAEKIAEYINKGSRLVAHVHSGVQKTEDEIATPEVTRGKASRINLEDQSSFASSFDVWSEKRVNDRRGLPRDTSYTPDPGRIREKKLDEKNPVTQMDKLKAKIKESHENR